MLVNLWNSPSLPYQIRVLEFPQEPLQEDSDVDLETGEVRIPTSSCPEAIKMTYKARLVLEDHQEFTAAVLLRERNIWDHHQVENNPSLFYVLLGPGDVRSEGQAKIQTSTSGWPGRSPARRPAVARLTKRSWRPNSGPPLSSLYEAFEDAYQFEHSELIADLRNHLVKTAVTQMTSLFTSSRCRTCYKGRHMDATWRRSRFETLLPFLSEIPLDSYRRAEDHQANVLLEKTALVADGPRTDKYLLGLSTEDQRLYASLQASERKSFDEELAALANTNSLISMSRRWESQKDSLPSLEINLGHAWFQKMRQLRRQNLLPIAQALLHRYYDHHENLIVRFRNLKVKNWRVQLHTTTMSNTTNKSPTKEVRDLVSSCSTNSATLNKLLPVKICGSTVLWLIDSGNSFYNAISLAVATKIGLTYYQPYDGPPVGTALAGSNLDVVGLIKSTTFSLIDESGKEHRLSSPLVIVRHLSCGLNISLPFLVENGLDQLHSQGVLLLSQKNVKFPLYRNLVHARRRMKVKKFGLTKDQRHHLRG